MPLLAIGGNMAGFNGLHLPAALITQKGYNLREKVLWAYIQSFPEFFASDLHIARMLQWPEKTVSNTLSSIRSKSGIEGRNFPKSGTIPCLKSVNQTSLIRESTLPESGNIE